ncbi:MAG: hypothetical protein WA369_15705 [Candidatus Acidiferrales bacterium]
MRRLSQVTVEACFAGLFLCAGFASHAAAQTNTTGATNPSPGQSAEAGSQAPSAPVQPPAKKVWTNDDVTGLREDSVISTFSAPRPKATNNGAKPSNPKGKGTQWYQNRIAGLEAKLPPIDDQIGQLQAALSGQTVNTVRKWGGTKPDDWRVELADLQKKHDDIQDQINALKDQARHDGVPPSALP